MALHWPTFFTRLGSAVVFSAIMMLGLLWNAWSFLALCALIMVLCLREYFRLIPLITGGKPRKGLMLLTIFGGLLLLVGTGMALSMAFGFIIPLFIALTVLPVLLLLLGILPKDGTIQDGLTAIGGLAYIVLPCLMLVILYGLFSWITPLVLILCIWMNDTMAYLVGSFIGKTPFSPISPKKTWEGTAGGAILTVAGALLAAYLIPGQDMIRYGVLALSAAIAGTAGDLLESKLKRLAGVKDSGTMMPGHGGALDRFDSLLVATPFAFTLVCMLEYYSLNTVWFR